MTKNTILILLAAATLTSCRGGSKNAAEVAPNSPPPASPAPASPAPPEPPAPPAPGTEQKLEVPRIGKTLLTHFRVRDVKKFRQIATKGKNNENPDYYAVNGKLVKHQPMLAELKKGATACFSRIVGREVRKNEMLLVTSSLTKQGEGQNSNFHFANIASSDKPENGIVVICMKHGPVTGAGFKQALGGIVELVNLVKAPAVP